MKSFLNLGSKGSKIVVTSRSKKVAKVVGDDSVYELKGLSGEDSWNLFKRLAFKQGNEPLSSDDHLFAISHDIVEKCAGVPLSIRVVGSLLYDQDESKWVSLRNANLMKMGHQGEDGIMPILKFSYYHLTASLKSCFSYCALFPKDALINKKKLIWLWMAQGCLEQIENGRSEEDVGEEFFSILLHRCFLQDVIEDEYGDIESCKMHDLIHDLAQEVAGKETVILDSHVDQFDHKIRHLSLTYIPTTQFCEMKTLRTFLRGYWNPNHLSRSSVSAICSNFRRLRMWDLRDCKLKSLPDTIGNLLHLRYLDLSLNRDLEVLPNSITKLHNLQVLNIILTSVRALPRDTYKLVNLRHLMNISFSLTHMPAGIDRLTCLRTLKLFVVGNETSKRGDVCKLRDLKALVNLRGELQISFNENSSCDVANYKEIEILTTEHLKKLTISFSVHESSFDETLLGALQPHSKLKAIVIDRYKGIKLPTWAESLTASLPHLVKIDLGSFYGLETLPSLSQLRHLKELKLADMPNLKFVECDVGVGACDQLVFFPSLEKLKLSSFPKLKGWWKEEISSVTGASSVVVPSFSQLCGLDVSGCPRLTILPPCPSLKYLRLYNCKEALTFLGPSSSLSSDIRMIEHVTTDNAGALECLFRESFAGIHCLEIQMFKGESLYGVAEKYVSSIEDMKIYYCQNLRSLSGGGLEHLSSLKNLSFINCENLELEKNEQEGMPWKSLHNLSSLNLCLLPKLVSLPKGLQHLTSLQELNINYCVNLEALPEWLNCLSSLEKLSLNSCFKLKTLPESIKCMPSLTDLHIICCRSLEKRCRELDGEDWHKVRRVTRLL